MWGFKGLGFGGLELKGFAGFGVGLGFVVRACRLVGHIGLGLPVSSLEILGNAEP